MDDTRVGTSRVELWKGVDEPASHHVNVGVVTEGRPTKNRNLGVFPITGLRSLSNLCTLLPFGLDLP
jgi:hypothetical protein